MSITITHAKIIKGKSDVKHLSVSFLRSLSDGKKASCEEEFPNEIHEDLKNAFGKLDVHLAIVTESIDETEIELLDDFTETNIVDNIHAASFALVGSENSSIVISGHKILKSGKAFNFNSPSVNLNEDDENAYQFSAELKDALVIIKDECEAYMNGKHAPEVVNGTLDFPEEGVTNMKIATPSTPEGVLAELFTEKNQKIAADKKAMPVKSLVKNKGKKKK